MASPLAHPPALPQLPRRQTRSVGFRLILGLFVLVLGMAVSFLAGSGTAAIYARLVPLAPDVVGPLISHEEGMKVVEDRGVLVAIMDPRSIRLDLAKGWDREENAFRDKKALLYFTGPFFEEEDGKGYDARVIGDLYFYGELTPASDASRGFANRRYHFGLTRRGRVKFGYGGWKPGYDHKFRVFIGGLGFLYGPDKPPADYSDPYKGLKQRLHDAVPRERLVVGRDDKNHLIVLKTPPRNREGAMDAAKGQGLIEAYYLDQGNKARFIVPAQIDDRPRYNLPYLLRVADRDSVYDGRHAQLAPATPKPRKKRRPVRKPTTTPTVTPPASGPLAPQGAASRNSTPRTSDPAIP